MSYVNLGNTTEVYHRDRQIQDILTCNIDDFCGL